VGAFREEGNARAAYTRLVEAGFRPSYERYASYLRVVVGGIREVDLEDAARLFGAAGFPEVLFTEER
jgi:hypothetical protein